MPPDTYSIAQIQGYLLRKKRDPLGAAQGVEEWIFEQEEERRSIAATKRRRRAELARQYQWAGPSPPMVDVSPVGAHTFRVPLTNGGQPFGVEQDNDSE